MVVTPNHTGVLHYPVFRKVPAISLMLHLHDVYHLQVLLSILSTAQFSSSYLSLWGFLLPLVFHLSGRLFIVVHPAFSQAQLFH